MGGADASGSIPGRLSRCRRRPSAATYPRLPAAAPDRAHGRARTGRSPRRLGSRPRRTVPRPDRRGGRPPSSHTTRTRHHRGCRAPARKRKTVKGSTPGADRRVRDGRTADGGCRRTAAVPVLVRSRAVLDRLTDAASTRHAAPGWSAAPRPERSRVRTLWATLGTYGPGAVRCPCRERWRRVGGKDVDGSHGLDLGQLARLDGATSASSTGAPGRLARHQLGQLDRAHLVGSTARPSRGSRWHQLARSPARPAHLVGSHVTSSTGAPGRLARLDLGQLDRRTWSASSSASSTGRTWSARRRGRRGVRAGDVGGSTLRPARSAAAPRLATSHHSPLACSITRTASRPRGSSPRSLHHGAQDLRSPTLRSIPSLRPPAP